MVEVAKEQFKESKAKTMTVSKHLSVNGTLMGLAILLLTDPVASLRADSVTIISPDKAETYPCSRLAEGKFVWLATARFPLNDLSQRLLIC